MKAKREVVSGFTSTENCNWKMSTATSIMHWICLFFIACFFVLPHLVSASGENGNQTSLSLHGPHLLKYSYLWWNRQWNKSRHSYWKSQTWCKWVNLLLPPPPPRWIFPADIILCSIAPEDAHQAAKENTWWKGSNLWRYNNHRSVVFITRSRERERESRESETQK